MSQTKIIVILVDDQNLHHFVPKEFILCLEPSTRPSIATLAMELADKVAKEALSTLTKFPRGSLPDKSREWTVFCAIVQEDSIENELTVVSAGSGTRCLGRSEMSDNGDLLHDSHAEVIAVRAFKRHLMDKILQHLKSPGSTELLEGSVEEDGLRIKDHIKFHLFTTHPPCGDATIFPSELPFDADEPPSKKTKILSDFSFTGAKLIRKQGSNDDVLAQDISAVRTKPGRGERTISMSCSDKMAKWLVCGVQGSLLHSLLHRPIYLQSITMAKNSSFNRESLERALYKRFSKNIKHFPVHSVFQLKEPEIFESSFEFPYAKDDTKAPCPKSIIYSGGNVEKKPLEISVDGRRQGVAKKNISKPSSRLKICRRELLNQFLSIRKLISPADEDVLLSLTYGQIKERLSREYSEYWSLAKEKYFKDWTVKPENLKGFKAG